MKRVRLQIILYLLPAFILPACSKSSFLDKKPDSRLVVPTTLDDFQALLDNQYVMQETPELGELSADNFYMTNTVWQGLVVKEQNAYLWRHDIYGGDNQIQVPDWDIPYQQVLYANVVLDGLQNIIPNANNQLQYNSIKGTAYFIRAYALFNVAQLFAPVYDPATAATDTGIVLRTSPDVNQVFVRATVQDTYDSILTYLRQADTLLSSVVPINNLNRPSKPAARAMLARVYLSMRAYSQAGTYANNCLQLYSTLMRYDTLPITKGIPIATPSNAETLYQSTMLQTSGVLIGALRANVIIDSNLFASYAPGDLRKMVYYKMSGGLPYLKGSYNGSAFCFSGLAVDEVYLTRAECAARAGDKDAALKDLNYLLKHRWDSSVVFSPVTAASAADALDSVLVERRKELAFRGLRWTDLRRLNKEGANITLHRFLNGTTTTLSPSHPNYTFMLPPNVISLSHMHVKDFRTDPN